MENLKIVIEAALEEGDRVRLSDLANELQAVNDLLSRIDKQIARSNSPSMYFRVESVKYSSPLTVELMPIPLRPSTIHAPAVTHRFITDLSKIKMGVDPEELDSQMIEAYKNIGRRVRKSIRAIHFSLNGTSVTLDDNLASPINKILGSLEYEDGEVSGVLELLSIHGGVHRFNIYPNIGAQKVECFFPPQLLDKGKSAIGSKVDVIGRLHYKSRASFPHAIEVREFEIVPDDSVLPKADELYGIAPDATGGLSSEEFVAQLRSGK